MLTDPARTIPRFEVHRSYHGDRTFERHGCLAVAVQVARWLCAVGTRAEVRDALTGERLWPVEGAC